MRPTDDTNFCRVFELPEQYPEGYLFSGGKPVGFLMVDWFQPWPVDSPYMELEQPETWEQCKKMLLSFLLEKRYVRPGKRYILITDFGESMVFGHGTENHEEEETG